MADLGTRVTLLDRLRLEPADPGHWAEFVDVYGGRVYAWCRRWGLQEADARDVTQIVLLKLAGRMRDFAYDPGKSFRAWLKTVAHHAWRDFVEARDRPGRGSGDSQVRSLLEAAAAPADLAAELEAGADQELFDLAARRVRLRVAPQTWDAFRLTTADGLSGAEAAARTGLQVAQVYVAKRRVLKMLQDEVARLDVAD
jgi:RNA polymerase sigma factor (sigma-70 family)